MGISVKSRSRQKGKERDYLGIPNENFEKIDRACVAFGCKPYFAILVDADSNLYVFILSKAKLLSMFPMGKTLSAWKMGAQYVDTYKNDKEIVIFQFKYETLSWWPTSNVKV
jgi:hypothetical protein